MREFDLTKDSWLTDAINMVQARHARNQAIIDDLVIGMYLAQEGKLP